jgi:hypothetical protein
MSATTIRKASALSLVLAAVIVWVAASRSAAQRPPEPSAANPNAASPAVGTAAPKALPGADVLLKQRRTEVVRLEAAWNAKRLEVERYLSDVGAWSADEVKKRAEAYRNAMLKRQVAEISMTEYEQGIYPQDRQSLAGEIALTESDMKRADDRVAWAEAQQAKGHVNELQLLADHSAAEIAKFRFEQAQLKLEVLDRFTKPKTMKELQTNVEVERIHERDALQLWELAKANEPEFAKLPRPTMTEAYISKLLGEVVKLQQNAIDRLGSLPPDKKLGEQPAGEARATVALQRKAVLEAKEFEDEAKQKLAEALDLARLVETWRTDLRQAQSSLAKARDDLARLEKMTGTH